MHFKFCFIEINQNGKLYSITACFVIIRILSYSWCLLYSCLNEVFFYLDIPREERGPYCFTCDTTLDPHVCHTVTLCTQHEVVQTMACTHMYTWIFVLIKVIVFKYFNLCEHGICVLQCIGLTLMLSNPVQLEH